MPQPTSIGSSFWTLEYQGVEKSFADWGLAGERGSGKLARKPLHVGELIVMADGQPFDSAPLFAFGKQVVVRRDRVGSGNSYTGGMTYFVGYASKVRRIGKADAERVQYTLSDLWWLLSRTPFTQSWPIQCTTLGGTVITPTVLSHVSLNIVPDFTGNTMSVPLQITKILDTALLDLAARGYGELNMDGTLKTPAFAYDVSELPNYFPTFDEVRDVTCADAIKKESQWIPGMLSWVDYAALDGDGNLLPKIHFTNRFGNTLQVDQTYLVSPTGSPPPVPVVSMPKVSLQVGDGVTVIGGDIEALNELLISQVQVVYEASAETNGQTTTKLWLDQWPLAGPDNKNGAVMRASIALQLYSSKVQVAPLASRPIQGDVGSILLADGSANLAWWMEKNPCLRNATVDGFGNPIITITGVAFTDTSGNPATPYAYELLHDGAIHPWMGGHQSEVVVTGYAYYTDRITGEQKAPEYLHTTVKTTDLAPKTYTNTSITYSNLPSIPFGMAWTLYNLLSVLQYQGSVKVKRADGEVSDSQFLGCLLNLTGGAAEWATMDALVQGTEEDLESGEVVVKFGANKFLNPGQIVDLLRATRMRTMSEWVGSFALGGGSVSQEIQMLSSSAKQDTARGTALYNVRVTGGQNPDGTNSGYKLVEDATTGQVTLLQLNPDGTTLTTALVPPLFSGSGLPSEGLL